MDTSRPVDYLIVGLGNPGEEYVQTRHNADVHDVVFAYEKGNVKNSLRIVLAKPFTYMNDSGKAVAKLVQEYRITDIKRQVLVISDDINTLPGSLTIQDGGDLKSLAGQKGQESIATELKTTQFIRFRLGVGKPPSGSAITIPQWVLGPFSTEKREMDLFAYLMGHTTQALFSLVQTNDLAACRKKFAKSSKMPKPSELVPTTTLVSPIRIEGM
ncbi:hypothetical protein BGZ73_006222 [Actinomortierella ambigua]|nr:hypothetical protein BGZ73_006222 [Actinomortierella ambigua]